MTWQASVPVPTRQRSPLCVCLLLLVCLLVGCSDGERMRRQLHDLQTLNQTVYCNDIGFHRGYTGHEMMPEFGLINMNGRLYDPFIGRFLSCDNFVQQPDNSQNFNRYSYCLNNPPKYTCSKHR